MEKNTVKQGLTVVSCAVVLSATVAAGIKLLPNSVCYSVSTNHPESSLEQVGKRETPKLKCRYDSVYDIPESSDYVLSYDKEWECIFVKLYKECIYKVDADFGDFPDADKKALEEGITVQNKGELVQIIEYMES